MEILEIKKEFKDLIPPLTSEEYKLLEESILKDGCIDPIIQCKNIIIDGHNRYEICKKHLFEFQIKEMFFDNDNEIKIWIIKNQFGRRNLSAYDRSILALELRGYYQNKAKENLIQGGKISQEGLQISAKAIDTRRELGKIAGVSHDTIEKVKKIQEKASDETKQKIKNQEISINRAFNDIKKDERKVDIEQQKLIIIEESLKPEGLFDIIVVDPPWNYGREYDPENSRVANPYPEMSQKELLNIEIPSKENSIIWLWTTHSFIWDAKELLNNWGFEYKAIMVWNKEKMGMGHWLRMQCEFCLLGIKGKPIWDYTDLRDIISESRREHSRKPDSFYTMIDKKFIGSKIDMFSRQKRDGWYQYGNDKNKF